MMNKIFSFTLVMGLTALLGACGEQSQKDAATLKAAYTCEAKDLFTGKTEIKSGASQHDACTKAQKDCEAKTGNTCVVVRYYDDTTTADGMTSGRGWACKVSDDTGRSWVRPGKTINEARKKAMEYCEEKKAGINCQIVKCFDASY
jgi:hypothetical protein